MNELKDYIENPLTKNANALKRKLIIEKFPCLKECSHNRYLSLYKYLNGTPQRFFSTTNFESFFSWLNEREESDINEVKSYLVGNESEINHALVHLEQINHLRWHDYREDFDDLRLIQFLDQEVHPTYLRVTESIFTPLCRIVAYFSRLERNKSTEGLNLWSIVQELGNTSLKGLTDPYIHIVRNGIAHGGITYFQNDVLYRDKKGNEKNILMSEVVFKTDCLIDTCNAIALALSLFFLTNQKKGFLLPQQLLLEELKEETKTPWWEVVSCTPSSFTGLNQFVIYSKAKTSDFWKVQISTLQTGILGEFFAPGYDRYFLYIQSNLAFPGHAAFNGKKLLSLREKPNSTLEEYVNAIEERLVFYVPRIKFPRFIYRLHTLFLSFKLNLPLAILEVKKQLGKPEINVRESKIHRNSWGVVLNASVFIEFNDSEVTQDGIRKHKALIIRRALSDARRTTGFIKINRHLPLGFARIKVFCKDYRRRRLSHYGLSQNLVCTVQIQKIKRINCPDIFGSKIEQLGKYRLAWNKAWLDHKNGQPDAEPDPTRCSHFS